MIESLLLAATLALGPERPLTPATFRPVGVSARFVSNGELDLATWDSGVSRIGNDGRVLDEAGIRFGSPAWAVADGESFLIFTSEDGVLVVRELDRDGVQRELARRALPTSGYQRIAGVARTADSFCLIFSSGRALILDPAFDLRALISFDPDVPVAVASNGSNYLVLFANGGPTISSVAISPTGAVGAVNRHVDANAQIDTASLVSDGTSYFAVWSNVPKVHGLWLAADAQASGPIVRFADDLWYGHIFWGERRVDATWDGQGIALSWIDRDARRLMIGRFSRDGEVMTPPGAVNTFGLPARNPSLAFARDHYIVSWTEADGGVTRLARVESDTFETSPPEVLLHRLPSQWWPRTAAGTSTYGVVWADFGTHLRFARFTRDGVPLDGGGLLLGGSANGYAIAFRDGAYVIVWSNGTSLHGAEISEGGNGDATVRNLEIGVAGIFPELAVNGNSVIVVWRQPGASPLDHTPMFAAEIRADGTLGPTHPIEENSSLSHTDARIVPTRGGYLLAYSLSYCSWKTCGHEMTQRLISLDVNGAPVSEPVEASGHRTLAMAHGNGRVVSVQPGGSGYVAVLRTDEGAPVSDPVPLGSQLAFAQEASVLWSGEHFLIATVNEALMLTTLAPDGTIVNSAAVSNADASSPALVASGPKGLLIYGRKVAVAWRLALRTIGIARQRPAR